MGGAACPNCGRPLRPDSAFCPKCGAALATLLPRAPRPDTTPPRRILSIILVVGIGLAVSLVYVFGFYVPETNVVTMEGGSWVVNGASSALGVQVGCSDCGQRPVPGTLFTVDINVAVTTASCGPLDCPGYTVLSISVSGPFAVTAVAPDNIPYTETPGQFDTWAITIQAPDAAGHFPLGGVVAVSYV
ncbi:MAG TPA: zinc ribbon domain-containing protein [Thermoplasmata archaeon]|nr:zinc ribbon domain-containing protein [Thermoplasmata archaeon]